MDINIFYSWQSDTDSKYNRNFIESCIKNALKSIKKDKDIKFEPVLDRDTKGKTGTPDITKSIFDKIDNSQIFVADISIINNGTRKRINCNPNVLIELGYAAGKLGWERIVLICNEAYGIREKLPFDLRGRRILSYSLNSTASKSKTQNMLVQSLQFALSSITSQTNLFNEQFIARFFTYINNKILIVEKMLFDIIRNIYLNLGIKQPNSITYLELKNICEKINCTSLMLSYSNGRNYNSWYEYLGFISKSCRNEIKEILAFNTHLNVEFLGALSQVDAGLFSQIERLTPPNLNVPVFEGQTNKTSLNTFSYAIFSACSYQRIAINLFFSKYGPYQKIAMDNSRLANKVDERLRL